MARTKIWSPSQGSDFPLKTIISSFVLSERTGEMLSCESLSWITEGWNKKHRINRTEWMACWNLCKSRVCSVVPLVETSWTVVYVKCALCTNLYNTLQHTRTNISTLAAKHICTQRCVFEPEHTSPHAYTQTVKLGRLWKGPKCSNRKKISSCSDIIKNTHCVLKHTYTHT